MSKKHIKKPVMRGYARVPALMQLEAVECGAASLAMLMSYYDKWLSLEQLRLDLGISRDGAKAGNILRVARKYGFEAKGFRFEPEELKTKAFFPCIIHWNFNHFVVLCGFSGNKAVINDPARGIIRVTMKELDEAFTGVCLLLCPSESFEVSGKRKSIWQFVKKRLAGAGGAVAFLVLTGIITYIFSVINPAMAKIFADKLLTNTNQSWLYPFIGILSGLALLQITAGALQAVYSVKINGKMAVIGNAAFMWKVLKLPMEFFSQRMAGDIMLRQQSNARVAETLVNTIAPLVLGAVMMIVYLAVMIKQSLILTAVGLAASCINIALTQYISAKRVNITRVKARDDSKLKGATIRGIEMIETIKSSGSENGFFEKWAGYHASVVTQNVRLARINHYLGALPPFIATLSNYIILFLGVYLVIQGSFTLGTILSFQGIMNALMQPLMMTVNAGQIIQEMRTQMERIEDVMEYPDDELAAERMIDDDSGKLKGKVELKNVTFGYSKLSEPIIKNFSMTIGKGDTVALVGASGCGKSTLSKLILGLYKPWDGEILFDGRPIDAIDRGVFTSSVVAVDQDIILFEDTIANNIRMWDETIENYDIILAARDAQIHDDIMKRDGGYECRISEGGRNLSGGQRQRLEIARVLAQDPTVIIMDEATSALDARTEYELVKSVKERGVTCIIIAHRLSTIRDCDKIIVLDKGKVIECGTHDELYAKGGAYTELMTAE